MSADNYVVIRKFGDNDYRWAMGFASNDYSVEEFNKKFLHGPFKTPREAANDADEQLEIIEYGISLEEGCLTGDKL